MSLVEIWIDSQLDYEDIPGMSVGIAYDQEIVWSRGLGFADMDKKFPASPYTIYSICSISKLFTSIGIMQLRDEGKLRSEENPWSCSGKENWPSCISRPIILI